MAFCPECGKAVTPDEAACSCGKQLRSSDKKARAGRFYGTMMMTAPEVKQEPPANINAALPAQQAAVVASAAGMTSPRLGAPVAASRSSRPASAKQGSSVAPNAGAASLGLPKASQLKATMIGAGVAPQAKSDRKHATMLGGAIPATTPRSKPPATEPAAPRAKSSAPAPAQPLAPIAKSERPQIVRQTSPQASNTPSVRAVQSLPISAPPEGSVAAKPAAAPAAHVQVQAEAKTMPSPLPARGLERSAPNAARRVQVIPEVIATVVDPSESPNEARTVPRVYLPGDPMAPQPSAATRGPRLREHPFAPEHPEEEGKGNYILLYWAVCVALVAAVCALAFRLF